MTSTSEKTGKCLCGAVRFTARAVATNHHICHCGICRRWAGGPVFAASVASVTFEGGENVARYQSSQWAERGFCKVCGSGLFYYLKPANQYMMTVGAFDDAAAFSLALEIFVDYKPQGYALAGDHPRLSEAEALARFAPPQ